MFWLKQSLKMMLQNWFLPLLYAWYARRPVQKGLVLFADAHHDEIPFSMRRVYDILKKDKKLDVQCFIRDFGHLSFAALPGYLMRFMRAYAQAETVYICDYYLPVSSCKKRAETTVVQLWHSCGLMKKIAYDTGEDIPRGYRGDMFGNYSVLTLSAGSCVEVHAKALRLPKEKIFPIGISRTDYYFDEQWKADCRKRFYESCPEAAGRKIVLWAPTFRGNAAKPTQTGLEEMREAAKILGDEWYVIIKAHPHVDARTPVSNCRIPTEELLDVADVLVTDYSSVLFDYLIFEKPAVLFAPDLDDYEKTRGLYIDYRSLPFPMAENADSLAEAIKNSEKICRERKEEIHRFRIYYTGACDGKATERIIRQTLENKGEGN